MLRIGEMWRKTNEQDTEDKQAVSGDRYLDTVIRDFYGIYPVCPFDERNTADVFKSDSVYNACHRIYDHQQSESGKMDAV